MSERTVGSANNMGGRPNTSSDDMFDGGGTESAMVELVERAGAARTANAHNSPARRARSELGPAAQGRMPQVRLVYGLRQCLVISGQRERGGIQANSIPTPTYSLLLALDHFVRLPPLPRPMSSTRPFTTPGNSPGRPRLRPSASAE